MLMLESARLIKVHGQLVDCHLDDLIESVSAFGLKQTLHLVPGFKSVLAEKPNAE
jgi:hypothetical protein